MNNNLNAGNKGLINLGNTCYMNSALQCLSHLKIFHYSDEKFFNECKRSNETSLIYEWFQFQKEMWNNNNNKAFNPINILKRFRELCNKYNLYFQSFSQNDIDEFLYIFLDLLHKGINREVKMTFNKEINDEADRINVKSNELWVKFYEKDYSYIVENFYSQLLEITSCSNCGYYTTNHDPIQVLSLEINNIKSSNCN